VARKLSIIIENGFHDLSQSWRTLDKIPLRVSYFFSWQWVKTFARNIPGNYLNDLLNRLTNINQFCTCFMQLKHMKCVCNNRMNNVGCDTKFIISCRNILV
jgi:hypothetical protein